MMQLTKRTLVFLTLCLSVSWIQAAPSFQLLNDVWNGLGNASQNIIDGFKNATRDGAELTQDLIDDLHESQSEFVENANQIGIDLANAISESLTTNLDNLIANLLTNITSLETVVENQKSNAIKYAALQSGLAALKELNATAQTLQSNLTYISNQIDANINDDINEALEELKTWGEVQLERVFSGTNGFGEDAAKDVILAVIARHTLNLGRSLDELDVVKSDYELQLSNTIERYNVYAQNLIDEMNQCGDRGNFRCKYGIEQWALKVNFAPNELLLLLRRGQLLINSGLYASARVQALFELLSTDQEKCENLLDQIIQAYQTSTTTEENESSTAALDDSSTSSDDSSTSSDDSSTSSDDSSTSSDDSSTSSDDSSTSSDDSSTSADNSSSTASDADDSSSSTSADEDSTS